MLAPFIMKEKTTAEKAKYFQIYKVLMYQKSWLECPEGVEGTKFAQ